MNKNLFIMDKQHELIISYIANKYMIFTSYEFSLPTPKELKEDPTYKGWAYKTVVWEWDAEANEKKSQIGDSIFSGRVPGSALECHSQLCQNIIVKEYNAVIQNIKKENQKEIDKASKRKVH